MGHCVQRREPTYVPKVRLTQPARNQDGGGATPFAAVLIVEGVGGVWSNTHPRFNEKEERTLTSSHSVRPTQPRILPVAKDSPLITERFADRPGSVLNVSRTIANNSGVFGPWSGLARYLALEGLLPPRERELVILRVGWRARSIYEFGQHTLFGREAGLMETEIAAVAGDIRNGPWNDDEMALLEMVDELVDDDCVGDVTWGRLTQRWNPAELVELVLLIGFYRMVSSSLNSFGVELEEGVPGWPEGR
jgi:4-carboxymuconolactone decarboxylase